MIISSGNDYRAAAQRRLPPFLFHYIDGGAYAEYTLKRNVQDLSEIALRQRVLNDMSALSLETKLFNETLSMPVALAPVGLTGMYARRGEVQAAMAADKKVFHLRFQRFLFARLRKLHLQLTVRCGSSFMCYVTAVLCVMLWNVQKRQVVQHWCLP